MRSERFDEKGEARGGVWSMTKMAVGLIAALAITIGVMLMLAGPSRADGYKAGPYAGIAVGYGTGQISADGLDIAQDGANVAGIVGWTHDLGGLIAGIEGDIGYNGVRAAFADKAITAKGGWEGTARLRAGIPVGPALLYGTAGVAVKQTDIDVVGFTGSDTSVGVVGGGGIDLQMTNTMQVRLEALHYAYPDTKVDLSNIGTAKFDDAKTVVRAGVTFALN